MAPSAIVETVTATPDVNNTVLVKPWSRPQYTKEKLDWAPLPKIDLSKFDLPGGKEQLAEELRDAVHRIGFWTVVNTGIDDKRVLRQFSFGNTFFKEPLEEKRRYPCNFADGEYLGYRENSRWIGNTGVLENVEMLNIGKPHIEEPRNAKHDLVEQNWDEIESFHRDLFEQVIKKIFILIAIILELPEDYILNLHAYSAKSDDHLRYMIYNVRTQEEWDKAQAYSTGGHTDFGSLTLLFSQHIAGLQIKSPEDGSWKYVAPVEGGITVNAADTLSFLTKGYVKSTVHRVVTPPKDQMNTARLGLLYFVRPGDDAPMRPVPSPLLDRLGLLTEEDKDLSIAAPTGTDYVRARVKDVHHKKVLTKREGTEFNYKGLAVKNYYD